MKVLYQNDLDVRLPDRIVLTDNGAYDLEKCGIEGYYVWVGYEHDSRNNSKMLRLVEEAARDIVAPALANYSKVNDVHIEDRTSTTDMFRLWVEVK